jgi:hypothetical protein
MKQGKCFICHKVGHRASDHKKWKTPFVPQKNQEQFIPQKKSGSDAYRKIAAMMAELDDDEKTIALSKMEEEGF